jgi:hypothetical protein
MKSTLVIGVAAASLLVLGGCSSMSTAPRGAAAVPSPPGKDDCLFFRTLDDWSPIDRERLLIYGPGRVPYLATLSFPSNDLTWDYAVGFQDRDNDGRLCGHGFDAILFRDGIPDRITLASLQRIEKADAEKLLDAANPKRKARKAVQVPEGAAAKPASGEAAAPATQPR